MKHNSIICIDFGSAYTKVAIRSDWDAPALLMRDIPLAADDYTFCIPTVVAKVRRAGSTTWMIGQAAARQKRGDGVNVYEHFKAALFSDASSASVADESREVGTIFFRHLRTAIEKSPLAIATECPARVCIPRLQNTYLAEERILQILTDAGWSVASHPTLFEPESNAIGVFTRGRNATHFPTRYGKQSADRHPFLADMFEAKEGLLAAIRKNILRVVKTNGKEYFEVLIVDVGAFTTDFGYVRFQSDASFKSLPDINQLSSEVGVKQLDEAVRSALGKGVQDAVTSAPTALWEQAKRRLYAGEQAALPNQNGGIIEIGHRRERKAIDKVIHAFVQQIIDAEQQFRGTCSSGSVDAYALTGGGALIPMVRDVLIQKARDAGVRLVYDLQDEEEPKKYLLQKQDESGWHYDQKELEACRTHNRELIRGGSAMGGCSVFFDAVRNSRTG